MDLIPGVPDFVLFDPHEQRGDELYQFQQRYAPPVVTVEVPVAPKAMLQPVRTDERTSNLLRPNTFDDIVGQERAKNLLKRMVSICKARETPMDHVLLVGPSGTGKTTFAHVIAHELGARVFQLEAPISHDTLIELATTMHDGDILFLDEVHQQAAGDRRGASSNMQPEVLFGVMEDHTLTTAGGVMQFPHITLMGATTDEGALPDAFINRFPIRPRLDRYSIEDMATIAEHNAEALAMWLEPEAALIFARASRRVPREINNFVRNGAMLTEFEITEELALEVVRDLNGTTLDGLTRDMCAMLTFLYTRARRVRQGDGTVTYQASVSTVATAIGKSRDTKAIQLRVEPFLIEEGYVQVTGGGRMLTDTGVLRAMQLEVAHAR